MDGNRQKSCLLYTSVEYDERIFSAAESNREHAVSGRRVSFELTGAEEYAVPTDVDRCYFLIRFL